MEPRNQEVFVLKRSCKEYRIACALIFLVFISCARVYPSHGDHFSTPDERTLFRMRTLKANIEQFAAENGRLPASLEEVVPLSSTPGEYSFRHDGWGRLIVYSTSGSSFELRSLGPDGASKTLDDLIIQGTFGGSTPV